jgi:crotonobetainyl-CoA:carnitine CoA-transferase CaiB-like acyl-CoA transferase
MIQAEADAAALAGIRVLDLTTDYTAYAGRLLADLGADVVRVSRRKDRCACRLYQRGPEGECASFAHALLDAGKRSVTLISPVPPA